MCNNCVALAMKCYNLSFLCILCVFSGEDRGGRHSFYLHKVNEVHPDIVTDFLLWPQCQQVFLCSVCFRLASPRHGFTIMNRLSMENLTEPITKDLDFQLQHPFLLYRNARCK